MARRTAAVELAEALDREGLNSAGADHWEPYVWAMAAEFAGHTDPPDAETRRVVIGLLQRRQAQPDDFALFGGAG